MQYECTYILTADLDDAAVKERIEKYGSLIEGHGGTVTLTEHWGRKRLAYEIQKQREGNYVHVRFDGGSETLSELNRVLRLDDRVLRFLVVRDESPGAGESSSSGTTRGKPGATRAGATGSERREPTAERAPAAQEAGAAGAAGTAETTEGETS